MNIRPIELAEEIGVCRSSLDTYVSRFPAIWLKRRFVKRYTYFVGITEEEIQKLKRFAMMRKREGIYEGY